MEIVGNYEGFGANEYFELVAAMFYAETHYMRPGKSVPAAIAYESYETERFAAWEKWSKDHKFMLNKMYEFFFEDE